MNISSPSSHGFTVYSKSNCSDCSKVEILLEDYCNEMDGNFIKINCDEYVNSKENKEEFINFIKNVGKIDNIKTFPMVFYDGIFIGGFKETNEYIKCNLMKFDSDF